MSMEQGDKIYVAGHRGMVGSAIERELDRAGYMNRVTRTSSELDLRDQAAVEDFFASERPDHVFLAAAKVGGIKANDTYRAEFIRDNLTIQNNIIHSAYRAGVKKLIFLGSSCIYPKHAPQPMKEEHLLTGELEPTNEPYAIAKIAGIKMCEAYRDQYGCNFISAMPTNLYGPNDNYDLNNSHVLPALLRKFHTAKVEGHEKVEVWGSGKPRREFLHVDDLAGAARFMMERYDERQFLNVGTGTDISIAELAELIQGIVGFEGRFELDPSKPDGTPRKLLDVSRLHQLGWMHNIGLQEGIRSVYQELDSSVFEAS